MLALSPAPSSSYSFSASATSSSSASTTTSSSTSSSGSPKPLTSFASRPKPRRKTRCGLKLQRLPLSSPNVNIIGRPAAAAAASAVFAPCSRTPPVVIEIADTDSMYRMATSEDVLVVPRRCYQIDTPLHRTTQPKEVLRLLNEEKCDPDAQDRTNDAQSPVHRMTIHARHSCLECLLVHSKADINKRDAHNMTALHFAAKSGDLSSVKLILAFGADINAINNFEQTPLDMAIAHYKDRIVELIAALGGISAVFVQPRCPVVLPHVSPFLSFQLSPDPVENELEAALRLTSSYERDSPIRQRLSSDPWELQQLIEDRLQSSYSLEEDEALTLALQQQELARASQAHPELMNSIESEVKNGSRVLCLDGGGMRGLMQLEVLYQIEQLTGQKITDVFDIIIGCSTGALIALGLVYAKKSLAELRQLFLKMKEDIFSSSQFNFTNNTAALENLLHDMFGPQQKMSDVKEPKVLVAAVDKETTELKLRFFNNCFHDDFSDEFVWKVARYTSAAPMYFSEMNNYVDGSIIASNPCEYGLTRIQHHFYLRQQKLPIALVVSIGTGVYPPERIGYIDVPSCVTPYRQWLKPNPVLQRIRNFVTLVRHALVQSEIVAESCAVRCRELGIPFFRFSPQLREEVASGETKTTKLVNMILHTRLYLQSSSSPMGDLTTCFQKIAEGYTASRGALFSDSDILSSDSTSPALSSPGVF